MDTQLEPCSPAESIDAGPGPATTRRATGQRVTARLCAWQDTDPVRLRVEISVQDGWYVYAPGAADGVPTTLQLVQGGVAETLHGQYPTSPDGHLSGLFALDASVDRLAGQPGIRLRLQACNGQTCEMPEILDFGVLDLDTADLDTADLDTADLHTADLDAADAATSDSASAVG